MGLWTFGGMSMNLAITIFLVGLKSFTCLNFSYIDKIFYSTGDKINVCVGKEWYRFPSSFFISNPNWNLQFIQSEFKGQLPQHYAQEAFATRLERPNFNRDNREEPSRYVNVIVYL